MSKKDTDNFFLKEKDFKSLEGHKLELSYMDAVEPKDLNSIKQFIICCKLKGDLYWCDFEKLDDIKKFSNFLNSKTSSLHKGVHYSSSVGIDFKNKKFKVSITHEKPSYLIQNKDTPRFLFLNFDEKNFLKIQDFVNDVVQDWEKQDK